MSQNIPGRGKQRGKNYGQDLSTNAMSTGGGQMVMPPNNGVFALPTVPDYARGAQYNGVSPHIMQHAPASGGHNGPSINVPAGVIVNHEQPSHFAMQGLPQNNSGMNPNMQWQGAPQQQNMQQHMGQSHMAQRGVPQQPRPYQQQQQPAQMPYGGYMQQQQPMYGAPQYPNVYQQQYDPQQYAFYAAQQQQMQQQQQYYSQHQQMQQQSQQGSAMQMQAPPSLQQGGGMPGGAAAGVPMGGQPTQQQSQQPQMQGGVPPASTAQPYSAPVSAPAGGPHAPFNSAMQQPQQVPRPAAPVVQKHKKVLAIVDPTTNETVNQNAVEASKKEEEEVAPKADKEESKGTDETDSAAPEVKKQFAAQILEQTTKSDQPAPAPTAVPPTKERKCLFTLDQLDDLGLKEKASQHIVPSAPAAPPAAAPAVEQPKASEYLPEPLATPAYPNNYKEKQATPELSLPEMPVSNNDEQRDDSHLTAEVPATPTDEPASSSSDKNTSNDSAICVQTPVTPPPPTESVEVEEEKTVVVEEREEKEEEKQEAEPEEAPTPAPAPVEPLTKKLEQLVIAEASQEEAESEPSTPAPVTPSVSETAATLAEEEEDAEKIAAAREEEMQRKREELEAEIAKHEQDIDQVNMDLCRYNREYLYSVRDFEKLFNVTPCPLASNELLGFGVCRSLVSNEPKRKQDGQGGFMPGWARGTGGQRGGGAKPYQGRQSEQHHRGGGGGGRQGSNKKLPPSIRPSIERRVDTNVQLHKAEKAWKPEKVTETDESEETKKKLLLKTIRALFNKITPTTKDALIHEFLDHKVYESPCLNDVISIIFDKAVEEPKFCPLYSAMCIQQVSVELGTNKDNVSNFRNAILFRAQETFSTKNLDAYIEEKKAEIEAETDEKKKKEKQIELLEHQSKFRRRKFGNITFIGQLYLQGLLSIRIIHFCIVDLLKSVTKNPEGAVPTADDADEESVDCAVRLLETIGRKLQEESNRAAKDAQAAKEAAAAPKGGKVIARNPPAGAAPRPPQPNVQQFPLELTFQTLEGACPIVSSRIRFMIMNLSELRRNGWVPRKTADAGPKKLDEIKKDIQKEQMENQSAQMAYERKHSRQDGHMGGGRGPMGGGGGGGGNPKRMVIQRNSQDSRGNKEDRMSQAHKSSVLAPRGAPPKKGASLSSATTIDSGTLGGKGKNKWSGGASGGSENSKKEDRAAAIQSTSRFMASGGQRSSSSASMKGAEDEGASASGTATQVNSEDEREQNEAREKQEQEVTKRIVMDVGDYHSGEIKLEEVREEIFKIVGEEKYSKPSLATVFKCFMGAAIKKATDSAILPKFGHVLAFCLLKLAEEDDEKKKASKDPKAKDVKETKDEALKGVAEYCREIVEQEAWEDTPKIWDFFAEVLINAHLPSEGLYVGAHPALHDFKHAFLNAAKDTRKPYTLFVLVLKRLSEMHYTRDKDGFLEVVSWVLDEDCKSIVKHMDNDKLNKALEDTKMDFHENLHKILRSH